MSAVLDPNDPRWFWRVFWALLILWFLLILLPIMLADRPFNDDVVRLATGHYGWNANGRHLSNLLMRLLALGESRLVDLAPLPQLLALPILAYGSARWLQALQLRSAGIAVMAALPIGAQPFFLENLSYQFDAVFMALATSLALLAAVRWQWQATRILQSSLLLLACLSLYQPAINAFLVAWLMLQALAAMRAGAWRDLARNGLIMLAQVALLGWLHQIGTRQSVTAWVATHSALAPILQWPEQLISNLQQFLDAQGAAFTPRSLAWLLLTGVLLLLAAIWAWARRWRTASPANRWRLPLLVSILLLGLVLASFGPMLLVQDPIMLPRVWIGTGVLLASCFVLGALAIQHDAAQELPQATPRGLWLVSATMMTLFMAVHAYAYGNALRAQQKLEQQLAAMLMEDIWQLQQAHTLTALRIDGSMTQASQTQRIGQNFPLLGKMIWPYLHHSDDFTRHYLMPEARAPINFLARDWRPDWNARTCPEFARTRSAYRIRIWQSVAVVQLSADAELDCAAPASPTD